MHQNVVNGLFFEVVVAVIVVVGWTNWHIMDYVVSGQHAANVIWADELDIS